MLIGRWTPSQDSPFFSEPERPLEAQSDGSVLWGDQRVGRWLPLEGPHYHLSLTAVARGEYTLRLIGGLFEAYLQGESVWSARRQATRNPDWVGHWVSQPKGHELLSPDGSLKALIPGITLFSLSADGLWRFESARTKEVTWGEWETASDGRLVLDPGTEREGYFIWDGPPHQRQRVGPYDRIGHPLGAPRRFIEWWTGQPPHWSSLHPPVSDPDRKLPVTPKKRIRLRHGFTEAQWRREMLGRPGCPTGGCWVEYPVD